MIDFSKKNTCPLREGNEALLLNESWWLFKGGGIDLEEGVLTDIGYLLLINKQLIKPALFFNFIIEQSWSLFSINGGSPLNWDLELIDINSKLPALMAEEPCLTPEAEQFRTLDYRRVRQPKLESSWWQDPSKGLWELWGNSDSELSVLGLRARNPELDLQDSPIAIDFGTSSTVVAYSDKGKHRLLRVGIKDFFASPKSADYENPTVLEFIDFEAMLSAWQKETHRPDILWNQVRCSHEAKLALDTSDGNSAKVSSVLTNIKQWVLRNDNAEQVLITDRLKGFEHKLVSAQHTLNPAKGEKLQVSDNYPFDPVELYAWFLGMSVNWRQCGLFLQYHMTFPVKYTQEIRGRILAAFRRGLLRSLPESLSDESFDRFSVEERHSEPAAYAIAALNESNIAPTDEGISYAVFDFGGGTADFDYGLYRWASNEEENNDGTEEVLEQFGAGGDPFLGGEYLLANLAFEAFKHNLNICRENQIVFTKPENAEGFSGSEMLIDSSRLASTNSYRIMSLLRPLWETGKLGDNNGLIRLDLLNRKGKEVDCELSFNEVLLSDFLSKRILGGMINFFSGLKDAFANNLPEQCYLLLGGNSCRSPFVTKIFDGVNKLNQQDDTNEESSNKIEQKVQVELKHIFPEQMPNWKIIQPLEADKENPESKPTAKTGVAWGLLTLRPGSPIKVINHAIEKNESGDAPFAWFVGSVRRRQFSPKIKANETWDNWIELGKPREGVFSLAYTQEASAEGKRKEEAGLNFKDIKLSGYTQGKRLYARIISSNSIEVCTAEDHSQLEMADNIHEIRLN